MTDRDSSEGLSGVDSSVDLVTLGRRIRHRRRAAGFTLAALGEQVGRSQSALSLIESGQREPRLSLLRALADALGTTPANLLRAEAPDRRSALEIELVHAQRRAEYADLELPVLAAGPSLPTDALEVLVGMHRALDRARAPRTGPPATPEEARRANAALLADMRERDNYFADVEAAAGAVLTSVGRTGGALTQRTLIAIADEVGFTIEYAADVPASTRSITDLRNRRIYLPPAGARSEHDPRSIVLQTLGHFVLGHQPPTDYGDFLRQRVEANYFAAALLIPERAAVDFLRAARHDHALAVEDLRDAFSVSYETAAHRFTNLATQHLDMPVHFARVHESGTILKAYENDGVRFPQDQVGAIVGQLCCRHWASRTVFTAAASSTSYGQYTDTPRGTYWCSAHVEETSSGRASVVVGVPFDQARWFRIPETSARRRSSCPDDPTCCRQPPAELAADWADSVWPSARAHSHLLAAMPPGTFPGVDETDVLTFVASRAPD